MADSSQKGSSDCPERDANFNDVLIFLAKHQWLFDFKLTHIFVDKIWEHIPDEWLELFQTLPVEDLAGIPDGIIQEGWPVSLKEFATTCLQFSLKREQTTDFPQCLDQRKTKQFQTKPIESENVIEKVQLGSKMCKRKATCRPLDPGDIPKEIKNGMAPKKLHEVCHMTSLVATLTQKTGNDVIVDVGSGLSKHCHSTGADKRTAKLDECPYLSNVTCELTPDEQSKAEFSDLFHEWYSKIREFKCVCSKSSYTKLKESDNCCRKECSNIPELCDSSPYSSGNDKNCSNCCNKLSSKHCDLLPDSSGTASEEVGKKNPEDLLVSSSDINGATQKSTKSAENCENNEHFFVDIQKDSPYCTMHNNHSCPGNCHHGNSCHGNNSDEAQVCMIGLHCCGDLTPTMLEHFVNTDWITSLVCVSCCYHRMEYADELELHRKFPLSSGLKKSLGNIQSVYPRFRLSPFATRLAAQETRARWRDQTPTDHKTHTLHVAYRTILEICFNTGPFYLKKTARKLAHKADFSSFETYIKAVATHIEIQGQYL
ncbi:hypothetical protein MAR_013288 [Mya arenaria]|uniref:Methyltransferase domain-containing protein n=1 Tax=Mya arenaria TaxID=6604 RepID=A0ABY7G243_MYAAR|nr:hypothetical protein MAR_013288 [Mya arenaria]